MNLMVLNMLLRSLVLFTYIMILTGCAAPVRRPKSPCAGKNSAVEAIEALNSHRLQTRPIRATGRCLLRYHVKGKEHKENFPVKLWVNPPNEIYLQGDIAFNATGLVLGSNADELWFWLRPKEISSYWWSKWSQTGDWNDFVLSPAVLLEAFSLADMQDGDWSLTHGHSDILWLHNEEGILLKRVYVEQCGYNVARIEYFDKSGRIVAKAEFAEYKQVTKGQLAPAVIKITTMAESDSEDSVEISLGSIRPKQFSDKQRQRLFVRPQPRGFEHVYQIIDGISVEQIYE